MTKIGGSIVVFIFSIFYNLVSYFIRVIDAQYFLLNTYTAGLSPTILNYMVKEYVLKGKNIGTVETDEIGLKATVRDIVLPCGNTTIWKK